MRPSAVQTFHVRNPHDDDGVCLDSFVDWMAAADYRIEREPDYARWLVQFEARLRALPDEKRQRSVLPVLQRSEEHTSELPSLMRLSYAVFCLKKKNTKKRGNHTTQQDTTMN